MNGKSDDWKVVWDARAAALEAILGKSFDKILHATLPFDLGGFADVMLFPEFVSGQTYVTAELTGSNSGQRPSSMGNYELMICTKDDVVKAADLISRLSR